MWELGPVMVWLAPLDAEDEENAGAPAAIVVRILYTRPVDRVLRWLFDVVCGLRFSVPPLAVRQRGLWDESGDQGSGIRDQGSGIGATGRGGAKGRWSERGTYVLDQEEGDGKEG